MDEVREDEETSDIKIKRPFVTKFFRQLNHQQSEKLKKSKRKNKQQASLTEQRLEKFEQLGLILEHKSSKRLQEMNHNGNRIFATWKNDQINGEAEIHYNNGVVFKGIYQNGIKVKGHFKFLNGYEYVGNCLGNKFYGQGCLIFPSGKIISGEWKEYQIIGNGKIEYPQGEVYFGEVQNFKKHGKGYLFFSDGSKYTGEFQNGMISGMGTYYVDDKPVSKGLWANGELLKAADPDELDEQSIKVDIDEIQSRIDKMEKEMKQQATAEPEKAKQQKKTMPEENAVFVKAPEKAREEKENSTSITDCWNLSQLSHKNKKVRFS